jgi:hypothetical protein
MGPALFPEHAEWQRTANPDVEIRLVEGAPHGIHAYLRSSARYVDALREIIKRAS